MSALRSHLTHSPQCEPTSWMHLMLLAPSARSPGLVGSRGPIRVIRIPFYHTGCNLCTCLVRRSAVDSSCLTLSCLYRGTMCSILKISIDTFVEPPCDISSSGFARTRSRQAGRCLSSKSSTSVQQAVCRKSRTAFFPEIRFSTCHGSSDTRQVYGLWGTPWLHHLSITPIEPQGLR